MGFDKDYPNRKDKRRPYERRREKEFASCRPGGGCPGCENNRKHAERQRIDSVESTRDE